MRDEHAEDRGQPAGLSSLHVASGDRTSPASRLGCKVPVLSEPELHQPQASLLSSTKFKPTVI